VPINEIVKFKVMHCDVNGAKKGGRVELVLSAHVHAELWIPTRSQQGGS
jgi:hypothetical protein